MKFYDRHRRFLAILVLLTVLGTLYYRSTLRVEKLRRKLRNAYLEENQLRRKIVALETNHAMLQAFSQASAGPRALVCPNISSTKGGTSSPLVVTNEATTNSELAKILNKVAIRKEILVILATKQVLDSLTLAVTSLQKVGTSNVLIIAFDEETASLCQEKLEVPVYKRLDIMSVKKKLRPDEPEPMSGYMAALVSSLKFRMVGDILLLGYSVLLSDVDVIYLENPFNHLYRDSDVEGMTDGFSNFTSYGFIDWSDHPEMKRSRYVFSTRLFVFNSGQFYVRPTAASIELMERVYQRVSADPSLWDQIVYNEELFYPSRPGYQGIFASKRVMDYLLFMNSKTLFSAVVFKKHNELPLPVSIHVNYHSQKLERMQAIVDYYFYGRNEALDSFAIGDGESPDPPLDHVV